MQMQIIECTDEKEWEKFLSIYSPSALFQSWYWGDVQKKIHNRVYRFGIYKQNTLFGVMQVIVVLAKRGNYLHVRHGPVFTSQHNIVWNTVLAFLKQLAKKHRCVCIRINPLLDDMASNNVLLKSIGFLPSAIHRMDGEYSWVLDLDVSEDELLANMRKSTRYEIKKAKSAAIFIEESDAIDSFIALYDHTSKRQGFVGNKGIKEEFETFYKKNKAALYLGKIDNQIIAAAVILYYNKQAIYHHGASIPSKIPVSHAIQWRAICDAKQRGMNVYNFWGISDENNLAHPWRGLTLFKKGFGGREIRYIHTYDYPTSMLYPVSRMIELIRKRMKGYD